MIDLSNIIGVYSPHVDAITSLGAVDFDYIFRGLVLLIFLWVFGLCIINFFKSFAR